MNEQNDQSTNETPLAPATPPAPSIPPATQYEPPVTPVAPSVPTVPAAPKVEAPAMPAAPTTPAAPLPPSARAPQVAPVPQYAPPVPPTATPTVPAASAPPAAPTPPAAPQYGAPAPQYGATTQQYMGQQPMQPQTSSQPGTNILAILSLVFAFVFSIAGIVLGHMALNQIKKTGEQGRGLAMTGLILSYVFTFLGVFIMIIYFVAMAALVSSGGF